MLTQDMTLERPRPVGTRVSADNAIGKKPWEGKKAGAQVGSASALRSDM